MVLTKEWGCLRPVKRVVGDKVVQRRWGCHLRPIKVTKQRDKERSASGGLQGDEADRESGSGEGIDGSSEGVTLPAGSSMPGAETSIVVGPTCGGSQGTATTTALSSSHSQATVSQIGEEVEDGGVRQAGVLFGFKAEKQ
jgi:hypothetical protein